MTIFIKAVFHQDIRTIEFMAGNGDRMLRSGGTLAWLFNNPGNLRPKKNSIYPGQIGIGETKYGKLCIFSSVEAGRSEKRALLRRKYNPMTLRKAIYTYAPPSDNNDSEAYLSFVKRKTGLSDTVTLEDLSDAQLDSLMAAMEQMEGFDAKKDTRKEKWVHATVVTFSDGARPLPNQPVVIRRQASTVEATTDAYGRLPPLVTLTAGELITLLVRRGSQSLEQIGEFLLPARSQSLVLLRSSEEHAGTLAAHNPRPSNRRTKPKPIRYVIQPGDTMAKIAGRFRVDAKELVAANKETVQNPNRIFPGQVLWIHGGPAPQSAQPQRIANAPKVTPAARSKQNTGHPLAIVALRSKRAPWMETAIAELKRWGGIKEAVIDDSINYHKETGLQFRSLSTAWCASFVNYCLKSSGFKHSGSAGSQSFRMSQNFSRLTAPVYGALAVYSNPAKPGQGHVAFVYCKLKGGDLAVLGGNQGDSITFNPHKSVYIQKLKYKLEGYFVPIAYKEYAEQQLAQGGDLGDETHTLTSLRSEFGKTTTSTRADQNTR